MKSEEENNANLSLLMASGISGVIDHDFTDSSSLKLTRVKEMEDRAKELARKAVANLRRDDGSNRNDHDGMAGGNNGGSGSSLLAAIQNRSQNVQTNSYTNHNAATTSARNTNTKKYQIVVKKLRDFIVRHGGASSSFGGGGPSTGQILKAFGSLYSDQDAVIFKNMLNLIAKQNVDKKWCLRDA